MMHDSSREFIPAAVSLPESFVYVRDIIPDIVIDIRYFTENNFTGCRIDGYEAPACILTRDAALALKQVQTELHKSGLGLKIFDAYRPQSAVRHFVRWAQDHADQKMKSRFYPDLDKQDLFSLGFIVEQSGHSRGSTVDLTIVSLDVGTMRELDMGTEWDYFGSSSAPSDTTVSNAQRANRMLLQDVMHRAGFVPVDQEWWHFTLKDEPYPDTYFDFPVK
jgi:D-alanyl-D-alanine dipeptidase